MKGFYKHTRIVYKTLSYTQGKIKQSRCKKGTILQNIHFNCKNNITKIMSVSDQVSCMINCNCLKPNDS